MAKYSSAAQLLVNVPRLTIVVMPVVDVELIIDQADNIIESDLSKVIDFDEVTAADATTTPNYINLLSQYKTAERCLVSKYGAKRQVEEQSDRQYWEQEYDDLLNKILDGTLDISDESLGSPSFENNVRDDVEPALGMGEQGGFIDEDDLETQRDDYGND